MPPHWQAGCAGAGSAAVAALASALPGTSGRLTACGSALSGKHAVPATECGSARYCSGRQSSACGINHRRRERCFMTSMGSAACGCRAPVGMSCNASA